MPPNTKKCEKCGAVDDSGLTPRTNSVLCDQHDWKPTPAVEDWEKEFSKFYGAMFECGDFEELMDRIRSLRESDRKRTIEGLEKMKKNMAYVSEKDNEIYQAEHLGYSQGLKDAIIFITNLN